MEEQHKIQNKIIINGEIQTHKNMNSMSAELVKMHVVKGDLVRFYPFTENKGNWKEEFHEVDFEVEKVVKVLKDTWNSRYYSGVEIYLTTLD